MSGFDDYLILVALVLSGAVVSFERPEAIFYTQPILLGFVAVVLLGDYWKRHGAPPCPWVAIVLDSLGLVAAWWGDSDHWRVVRFGFPALLVLSGVLGIEQ